MRSLDQTCSQRVRPFQTAQFTLMSMVVFATCAGCGWLKSTPSPLTVAQVNQFARSKEPSELMDQILLGERACGGAEGVSILRAAFWLKRRDYQNALAQVAKVSPEGVFRTTSMWLAGEALFRSGNLAQSIRILNALIAEQPDDLEAHRCLAAIYFDISAMHQAKDELKQIIRLAPEDYRPHHLLGRIDLDFQKFDSAVKHYRTAIELCKIPGARLELRRGLGSSLRGDKRFDEILKWIPAEEPDLFLQTCRADALWSTGQTDEARRVLESVIAQDPNLTDALYLAARIEADQEQFDAAIKPLKQVLERNPHDVAALYQLALVQRQAGNLEEFQNMIRRKEQSQKLIDQLIDLNDKIIDNPGDPVLCLQIAEICDQLGKKELAASWRKAADGLNATPFSPN